METTTAAEAETGPATERTGLAPALLLAILGSVSLWSVLTR